MQPESAQATRPSAAATRVLETRVLETKDRRRGKRLLPAPGLARAAPPVQPAFPACARARSRGLIAPRAIPEEDAVMTATRRRVLAGGGAAIGLAAAPAIVRAQTPPARARTIRAVMHADLRVLDPIWTTANITAYHGAMIYDTLSAMDADFNPQPQMVGKFGVSDDKLTHTFELRDGLKFSDGSAVTAADCVASVRRWAARSGSGQSMMARVKDTPVVDNKTFRIVLSEPYGLVIDSLSTISTSLCYVMRRKDAETDPNQQVRETIGSGPFLYNKDETR